MTAVPCDVVNPRGSSANSCVCIQGNEARDTRICLLHEDFKNAMVGGSGFVWANDQQEGQAEKASRPRSIPQP